MADRQPVLDGNNNANSPDRELRDLNVYPELTRWIDRELAAAASLNLPPDPCLLADRCLVLLLWRQSLGNGVGQEKSGKDQGRKKEAMDMRSSLLQEALENADKCIFLDPSSFTGYIHRALVLAAKGDANAAISDFAAAISKSPDQADVFEFLSTLADLKEVLRTDIGTATFEFSLQLYRDLSASSSSQASEQGLSDILARAYSRGGDSQGRGFQYPEQYVLQCTKRGEKCQKLGKHLEAALWLSKAILHSPLEPLLHAKRCAALLSIPLAAVGHCRAARGVDSAAMAEILCRARADAETAFTLDPEPKQTRWLRRKVCELMGEDPGEKGEEEEELGLTLNPSPRKRIVLVSDDEIREDIVWLQQKIREEEKQAGPKGSLSVPEVLRRLKAALTTVLQEEGLTVTVARQVHKCHSVLQGLSKGFSASGALLEDNPQLRRDDTQHLASDERSLEESFATLAQDFQAVARKFEREIESLSRHIAALSKEWYAQYHSPCTLEHLLGEILSCRDRHKRRVGSVLRDGVAWITTAKLLSQGSFDNVHKAIACLHIEE